MPLIQIDLDRELFDSLGDKLSAAIHQAQLDALDIPSNDRFQVFTPHGPGELRFDPEYNGVDRQRLVLPEVADPPWLALPSPLLLPPPPTGLHAASATVVRLAKAITASDLSFAFGWAVNFMVGSSSICGRREQHP